VGSSVTPTRLANDASASTASQSGESIGGGTNLNTVTISIEHCDAALDNSTPLSPAQQEASFKLVAYLVQKYNIPLTHIKGHNSLDLSIRRTAQAITHGKHYPTGCATRYKSQARWLWTVFHSIHGFCTEARLLPYRLLAGDVTEIAWTAVSRSIACLL